LSNHAILLAMPNAKIIRKPSDSSNYKVEELRIEGLSSVELESFDWESFNKLRALNLVFCDAITPGLLKLLPKNLTLFMANINGMTILEDTVWKEFVLLTTLHLNGKWNSNHQKIGQFYKMYPVQNFTFNHPENDSHQNSIEFSNGEWSFEYFK